MRPGRPFILLFATGFLVCFSVRAQDAASPPNGARADGAGENASPAKTPPIKFQVLERRKIDLGNRSIILNRVAPPVLPVPPPASPPPPPPTAEQIAAWEALEARQPRKKYEVLFLSATVYDHQVTALRWSDENGSYRAYSNIDFRYFCGLGEFQTEDAVYSLLMGIGNDERAQIIAFNSSITPQEATEGLTPMEVPPLVSEFSQTRSEYFVVDDPEHPASDSACASIEALHIYFDSNKQKLIEKYEKWEAARVAKEKWDKDHPPIPKDTVINFWPEKSTVYPTAPAQ